MKIELLKKMINECSNIVVFSGAGVSTASGLKDFRSKDGLYSLKFDRPAEYMLSRECFYNETELFYNFYKKYMNLNNVKPNIVHKYFKYLEDNNKLLGIVTQNIDGLHEKAGNKKVYELHGSEYINHCIKCNKEYSYDYVFNSSGIPICQCGGIIKPDVVLYGESLNDTVVNNSIDIISRADLLLVVGTSLSVYPAAGLIHYFNGKYLVIINKDTTTLDNKADLVINDDLVKVFKSL